jgi:hypothetical protein
VAAWLAHQADDGYLGPWPAHERLTNRMTYPDGRFVLTWDTWGHYHTMLGLLLWYEETGDARALDAVRRIGDLLCDTYLGAATRLVDTGSTEMNLAPAHSLCLLYRHTGDPRHLALARQLVDDEFGAIDAAGLWLAGNWLDGALAGQAFFELPRPRWEALHPVMALVELHYLTGEARYREAFTRIWESIVTLDRHNNGGFSSGEQAQGNPFHQGAIETCCTIAWTALTVEMLRLTGDPRVADELELTLWNSATGMHAATGRWATYNTPMDGKRVASAHEIVFQAREGSPELNCCSVNSARGFGLLSEWAVMNDADGLCLNYYGPGTIDTPAMTLELETAYPADGRVRIRVTPHAGGALKLRIPRWSAHTAVRVNGAPVAGAAPGTYLTLDRPWTAGDVIELVFDMSVHAWVGARESAGCTSLYRGPLLLTLDRRYNDLDLQAVPTIDPAAPMTPEAWPERLPPLLLLAVPCGEATLHLCDFGSAGETGTLYRSWLPVARADALPQYFATDPEELLLAELSPLARTIVDPDAPTAGPLGLKALARALATADAVLAARASLPATAHNPRLQATLARLRSVDDAYATRVQAAITRLLAVHPATPRVLHAFTASPLLLPVPAIADVPLPAEIAFAPVPFNWDAELANICGVHGWRDGLVYLRTVLTLPAGSPGRLLLGADGPVKVWVNGDLAACIPDARMPVVIGAYPVDVAWQAGDNTITFAVRTEGGLTSGVTARAVVDT